MKLDKLDADIVALLIREPKISVLAASRRLGVARATVQARLDRLSQSGALRLAPTPVPARFGYPVTAFLSLTVRHDPSETPAVDALIEIPEVIEIHGVAGAADLLVKVAARSTSDLQRVIHRAVAAPGVERSSSTVVLTTYLEPRTTAIFDDIARERDRPD